jgi:hypothetical protein
MVRFTSSHQELKPLGASHGMPASKSMVSMVSVTGARLAGSLGPGGLAGWLAG